MALSVQRKEQPSRQQVEKVGSATGRHWSVSGPTRFVQVHPLLAGIVDQIEDWDIPDGDAARALSTKGLPSTAVWLIAQYRGAMGTDHRFGSGEHRRRQYRHVATMVRTGIVTLRASGPLGSLIVRLKPEGAAHLIGERMQDFADEKIALDDLFKAGDLPLLEKMLMEAPDSAARFALVENILLRNLRTRQPNAVVCRAAHYLRRNPSLSVRRLAARLDVSERHLSRSFRAMFGESPKQFARVARIEKTVAMRQRGSAWTDIAYACGFADQAHMINDFHSIVGEPPQQVFRTTGAVSNGEGNTFASGSAGPRFFER
jgi:AraC-like DNA-binding protein